MDVEQRCLQPVQFLCPRALEGLRQPSPQRRPQRRHRARAGTAGAGGDRGGEGTVPAARGTGISNTPVPAGAFRAGLRMFVQPTLRMMMGVYELLLKVCSCKKYYISSCIEEEFHP